MKNKDKKENKPYNDRITPDPLDNIPVFTTTMSEPSLPNTKRPEESCLEIPLKYFELKRNCGADITNCKGDPVCLSFNTNRTYPHDIDYLAIMYNATIKMNEENPLKCVTKMTDKLLVKLNEIGIYNDGIWELKEPLSKAEMRKNPKGIMLRNHMKELRDSKPHLDALKASKDYRNESISDTEKLHDKLRDENTPVSLRGFHPDQKIAKMGIEADEVELISREAFNLTGNKVVVLMEYYDEENIKLLEEYTGCERFVFGNIGALIEALHNLNAGDRVVVDNDQLAEKLMETAMNNDLILETHDIVRFKTYRTYGGLPMEY